MDLAQRQRIATLEAVIRRLLAVCPDCGQTRHCCSFGDAAAAEAREKTGAT